MTARQPAPIPESIKVGNFTYTVRKQPMDDYGATDNRHLIITICDDLAFDMEHETVMHEVLHCVHEAAGRTLPGNDDLDERAEQTVRLWAAPLLGALRANPALVAYLTDEP